MRNRSRLALPTGLVSDRIWRCLLAACHHQTSTPTRSASVGGRMHRIDAEAAARDQPGDQRVRVPHLASPGLVASPDRRRYVRHEVEQAAREKWIVCQPLRAVDRLRVGARSARHRILRRFPARACITRASRKTLGVSDRQIRATHPLALLATATAAVHHPGITGTSFGGSDGIAGRREPAWLSQIWRFDEAWDEESGLQACYGKALHLQGFSTRAGRACITRALQACYGEALHFAGLLYFRAHRS